MNKFTNVPDFLKTESKEEKKIRLINEISSISSQLNTLWRFHPSNPKKQDLVEEYKIMENYMKSSQEEFSKM